MKQWHCVNKKPALGSHPHYVFQTYVASFFTFSLHPCWLYVITSPLVIRQLCYGPTHVELVGKQTLNRLVGNAPTACLEHGDILQEPSWKSKKSKQTFAYLLWMMSCQGCSSAWRFLGPPRPRRLRLSHLNLCCILNALNLPKSPHWSLVFVVAKSFQVDSCSCRQCHISFVTLFF